MRVSLYRIPKVIIIVTHLQPARALPLRLIASNPLPAVPIRNLRHISFSRWPGNFHWLLRKKVHWDVYLHVRTAFTSVASSDDFEENIPVYPPGSMIATEIPIRKGLWLILAVGPGELDRI